LKRLDSRLGEFALPREYDLSRVAIECGDLAEPNLGLSADRFDELALSIDAIYHNGALVNFALPYSQLKAANVLGTQEIIRLACRHTAKRLHYVSTLSVFPLINTAGAGAWNETDQLTGPEFLWDGYSQSKWVAERLIAEVGQRGLPTTIYRPGRITGHSVTGRFEKNDLLMTAIQHCIQMGQVPAVDAVLDMTPVDFVGQAIVLLSLEPDSLGRCFHLKNPHPIRFSALVDWLRSHGHLLKDTSPMDWKRVSRDTPHAESINGLLALIPDSLLPEEDTWQDLPASEFNVATTLNSLDRYAVRCPPVDDNLLKLYLSNLERRQERPKLGTMLQV
jgi:thioester reductase-like protein